MAWAGIRRHQGRTVLPTDIFVLIFLALGAAAGSSAATNNEISVVVFTIVWMTAAISRVAELRRGDRPALQLRHLDLHTTSIFIVGSGSWVVLGFLQSAYPTSIVWKPIDVPPLLWAIGVALAIAVVAEPFLNVMHKRTPAVCGSNSTEPVYRFSWSMVIRCGAVLLLSGSPMFALLCALWLGVTLGPAALTVSTALPRHDRVDNAMPAPLT